ncbi:conjugal transfer protein TraG N-terminal domain-containing protein [Thermodesulfovibrio yellowstonii]|uniref:conjugal transfer protein TraG N-terminal domain-containing protein n=1 Tax=Thermodesulfovibrio yellowstonii TaxID=28262 RepID=UPI0003FF15FB|nr:conjugal transfer protein TraG N-terminal domain-containing protein [Thermodesulfovibrio islandicus]
MFKKLFFFSILVVVLLPVAGYSATWEVITHGGFDAAVSAWRKVALIFSDGNYSGLFISAAVLGALVLYVATYVKIATGTKAPVQSWFTSFMLGLVLYAAFVVPKDSIIIYDETLNRGPVQIDGIPKIAAVSVGLLNKIEKGLVDIITTSSDPASDYRFTAGGIAYNVLGGLQAGLYNLPVNFKQTLANYVKDCIFPETQRPGTVLNSDAIFDGSQKAEFVIRQAENPSLYVVSFMNPAAPQGEPQLCSEVGEDLISWLNTPDNVKPALQAACALAGYDPTVPQSLNVCLNTTQATVSSLTGNEIPALLGGGSFTSQALFSQVMLDVVTSASPDLAIKAAATSQTMSQFIGLGIHANAWIPILKESLMALAVGLIPLMALLIITPLAGRALSVMFGMMLWLTMWGIIDAVVHSFGVDYAQMAAESLKATTGGASGLATMLTFPSYSAKIAATFGALRWAGLMLSSVITAMFIKFGGTALAMLAGSIASMPQSSGAAAGQGMLTNPASVVQGSIMPTMTMASAASVTPGGLRGLIQGQTNWSAGQMAGQAIAGNELGVKAIAQGAYGNMAMSIGQGAGNLETANKYGMTPFEYGKAKATTNLSLDTRGVVSRTEGKYLYDPVTGVTPIEVNTGLISAGLQRSKEASYQQVFSKIKEAIDSKGIHEAWKIYTEHKDLFTAAEQGKLEGLFRKALVVDRSSGGSDGDKSSVGGRSSFNTSLGAEADAGFGGKVPAETPSGGKAPGPGGGNASAGAGANMNSSKYYQYEHQASTENRDQIKNEIARVFTDVYLRTQTKESTDASGRSWAKELLNSTDLKEASRAAEEYKEAEKLSQTISTNMMPIVLDRIAREKFGGDFDLRGGEDAYIKAYRYLVNQVYRGNYTEIQKYLDKDYNAQKQNLPGQNVPKEVNQTIENTEKTINEDGVPLKASTPPPGRKGVTLGTEGKKSLNLQKKEQRIIK